MVVGLHVTNGHGSGFVEATLSLGHLISLIFYKRFSYFGVRMLEYNTIQYKKGGHCGDLCTLALIDLLCSPYIHVFSSTML